MRINPLTAVGRLISVHGSIGGRRRIIQFRSHRVKDAGKDGNRQRPPYFVASGRWWWKRCWWRRRRRRACWRNRGRRRNGAGRTPGRTSAKMTTSRFRFRPTTAAARRHRCRLQPPSSCPELPVPKTASSSSPLHLFFRQMNVSHPRLTVRDYPSWPLLVLGDEFDFDVN